MPELPEVETVVRTLEQQIKDCTIVDVQVLYKPIVVNGITEFKSKLINQTFESFERRGKYLIFRLTTCTLVTHLRMEGKFFLQDSNEPINKHIHVIFTFRNGKQLRYHDTRKFGRMEVLPKDYDFTHFHDLGFEPFDDSYNETYVYQYCKSKNIPLKTLLLDQHFVAGIGNIYADEILFACGLRPGRSCKRITHLDALNIVNQTRIILTAAIQAGGTTIRSYTSSLGVTGRFQLSCKVHMQKTCQMCGSKIEMKYIRGRSSYYCPKCQK